MAFQWNYMASRWNAIEFHHGMPLNSTMECHGRYVGMPWLPWKWSPFDTYGSNPPVNVVPSTYDSSITVIIHNNRLNVNPHRSYCHSASNIFRAGKFFRASKFFRTVRTFRAESPDPTLRRGVQSTSGP